ncbi:MAG: hypothetical protein KGZ32_02355 [Dethiobacter sp.]|jgi:cytochrome c-type biogenesis protein|nr:hypothetical protein [Dethiobacter sp.]
MSEISFAIAFGAGVISFLSPCVLPLAPVYLANMAGASVLDSKAKMGFAAPFFHTLAFTAGFSLIFTALGAAAGLTGFAVGAHLETLHKLAGGLMICFGLLMLASRQISWLNFEKRLNFASASKISYTRSLMIGAAFSLGWTPCIGPVLGGVLTLAASSETARQGAYLLAGYSAGLGLPFVLFSLAIGAISSRLRQFSRYTPLLSLLAGLVLILAGALMLFDRLTWFFL